MDENFCNVCGKPIFWDVTEMWQHVNGDDSDACQPPDGIHPLVQS